MADGCDDYVSVDLIRGGRVNRDLGSVHPSGGRPAGFATRPLKALPWVWLSAGARKREQRGVPQPLAVLFRDDLRLISMMLNDVIYHYLV